MLVKWLEASAGCGKTTFLINESIKSKSNIIFLTFSNAAANELSDRLKTNAACETKVMTIHSFALSLIKLSNPLVNITVKNYQDEALFLLLQEQYFFDLYDFLVKNSDGYIQKSLDIDFDLKKATPIFFIDELGCLFNNDLIDKVSLERVKKYFFTQKNEVRKNIKLPFDIPTSLKEKYIDECINRVYLHEKFLEKYINQVKNTLFYALEKKTEELKKNNNVLTYDDIITKATSLVCGDNIFQLLGNVDKVFIDESQDLSFSQWTLIYSILKEWKVKNGTLIVAGDPKQLIYEFQGASIFYYKKFKNNIINLADKYEEILMNKTYRLSESVCSLVNKVGEDLDIDYLRHDTFNKKKGSVQHIKIESFSEVIQYINSSTMILFKQKTEGIASFAKLLITSGYLINSPYIMMHPIFKDFQYLLKWLIYKDKFSLAIIFNAMGKEGLSYNDLLKQEEMTFLNSLSYIDLEDLFFNWINYDKVKSFLRKKLQKSTDFVIEVLRQYAFFYKNDPYEAMHDKADFYGNNQNLFSSGVFFNTVHSSKGRESDRVILLDSDLKSKFNNDTNRLLYVALTRAKIDLILPFKKDSYKGAWLEKIFY